MIRVKFIVSNDRISGFSVKGHAFFAESGSDIVCASVSSAAFMAVNTITDIIKAEASVHADDGIIELFLKEENDKAQAVLNGLRLHLAELSKQYPDNIKVIYGGVKNA